MNFTELFANLPTSSLQDWEAAARKQLKGKPLDSIDVSMFERERRLPYAEGTHLSLQGGGSQGWLQFSSFGDEASCSGASLLEALNGGAQGLELSFQDISKIRGELSEVRFDFISLKINELIPADQHALIAMIPRDQRAASRLVVQLEHVSQLVDYEFLVKEVGEVKFLLSPKLIVGELGSMSQVLDAVKSILTPFENDADLREGMSRLGVEVSLSSDYLKNITFLHAARILFANVYHSFGVHEPLPRPYLFGRIGSDREDESHEVYLIDATAKAVAGISGGLDALTIEAYSGGDRGVAERRARNIQNVLAIEGLMGVPLNAVSGAAFFETAAKDLVSAVWPV